MNAIKINKKLFLSETKLLLFFDFVISISASLFGQNTIVHDYSNQVKSNIECSDSILFSEAEYYLYRGMSSIAIPKLFELLDKTQVNTKMFFKIQIALSEAYRQRREYNKGFNILFDIVKSPYIDDEEKSHAYTRIAALFNESKHSEHYLDSAYKYSEMALRISEKQKYPFVTATAKNEIGWIIKQREDFAGSLPILEEALIIFKKLNMYLHMSNVTINISSAYMSMEQYEKANSVIDSTIVFCNQTDDKYMLMRLYLHKSKLYKLMRDYENAFYYQEEARRLQLNFFNNLLDIQIAEMAAKYDLELKEVKIREEKLKSEKKQNEVFVLMILLGILLLVLILGFFIFYLQRKNFKQKHKLVEMQTQILEKDYEMKNKELTTAIAGGIAMDKILEEVKGEIALKNYNKAINVINTGLSGDRKWQRFMLNFNKQNPDFFSKLQKLHPNLTENDKMLCAFLKMGLKTKEIASVLNIEISGVNKGRQRLRKKLNLKLKENIAEYLDAI